MSVGRTANLATWLLPLLLMAGPWACPADDGPPKRHPSPKAVFDAWREARVRRDWRTCFSLLTSEVQDYVVFESYFSCSIKDSKESNAVLKRYGADWETLTNDLRRESKTKHGVEPTDDKVLWDALEKEYKASHGIPPHSTHHLLTDILRGHLKDKAGFCEAAAKVLPNNPASPIGDLERVTVQGDTATGHAAVSVAQQTMPPGEAFGKIEDKLDKKFQFREVDGGWLLDSL